MPELKDTEIYDLLLAWAQENGFVWKKVALEELCRFDGPSYLAVQQAITDHLERRGKVGEVAQYEPYEGELGYEFRITVEGFKLFVKIIIQRQCHRLFVVGCHNGWR